MLTSTPWRSAMAKIVSRWRTGSRSTVQRIKPTDALSAHPHRLFQQVNRAWADQHAALGKGDQLHGDGISIGITRRQHALEVGQSGFGVDVDMAADVGGPDSDGGLHLPSRLHLCRQVQFTPHSPFVVNEVTDTRARCLVGMPGQPEEILVQMRVRIDQAGQQELVVAVDDLD